MNWHGLTDFVGQLTWMGIAFGIVGYFFFREWWRRRENIFMVERMSPEQLADIRRMDAEIEAERKRRDAGTLWLLRLAMAVLGSGLGVLLGVKWVEWHVAGYPRELNEAGLAFQGVGIGVIVVGLFLFLEFLIELWLRRMEQRG